MKKENEQKMVHTAQQYQEVIAQCKEVFSKKMDDYGSSWRILRLPSLTDQIFIKAQRIRTIEEQKKQQINEGAEVELVGIINYCVMALIQLEKGVANTCDFSTAQALELYQYHIGQTFELMQRKNHDYGEVWRSMRVSSLVDIILQKLLRIKQIEDNKGKTIISEGVDAGYQDIINYAVFALILISEKEKKQ